MSQKQTSKFMRSEGSFTAFGSPLHRIRTTGLEHFAAENGGKCTGGEPRNRALIPHAEN